MSRPWALASLASRGSPEVVQAGAYNPGAEGNALLVAAGGRWIDRHNMTRYAVTRATTTARAGEEEMEIHASTLWTREGVGAASF